MRFIPGPIRGVLARGTFSRKVATLAAATAVSQLMLLATGPVLTRLYSPAAWGSFGLLAAYVAMASVVTALCFDRAIVGAASDDDAAVLAVASMAIAPAMTAVSVVGLLALMHFDWLGFGQLPRTAALWAAALLLMTQVFASLRYWHLRHERIGLLARTAIAQNLARALLPAATAAVSSTWAGLAAGEAMGRGVGVIPLWSPERGRLCAVFHADVAKRYRVVLKRYAEFALAGVPSSLLDAIAVALPLPLIAAQFGALAAGQFALAQRVVQAPLGILGRSVADALHARLATEHREGTGRLPKMFTRTAFALLAMSAVPAVVILGIGPRGFAWIFGPDWSMAGTLAITMLPWAASQMIVSPLSRVVLVLGGQRGKLVYDATAVVLVLASLLIARANEWTLTQSVVSLSVGQMVAYSVYFAVLLRLVRQRS